MRLSRTALQAAAATAVLAWATPSQAQEAACHLWGTSLADAYLNPPEGGDADFFTVEGAFPSVIFLFDNSGSMWGPAFEPRRPTGTEVSLDGRAGCRVDALFNAAMVAQGWVVNGVNAHPDFDPEFPGLFQNGSAYRYYSFWNSDWAGRDNNRGHSANHRTFADACSDTDRPADCEACLAERGYYRGATGPFVQSGNLMNIFPPRFHGARKVTKDVIRDVELVRMGMAVFRRNSTCSGDSDCWNNHAGAEWLNDGFTLNPQCHQATDPDHAAWENNRDALINGINNTLAFYTWTPLAESLLNVGQYYTRAGDRYPGWFGNGWTRAQFNSSTNDTQKSWCWECQNSAIIVITDGEPCQDNMLPDEIRNLGPDDDPAIDCRDANGIDRCTDCSGEPSYLHKVAWWLHNHDMRSDYPSPPIQSVNVYTIGFAIDRPILAKAAELGGGRYYTARDATELKDRIMEAIADIQSRASTFTSPRLAGIQTHATQGLLTPRFTPDSELPWKGDLLRFDFVSEFIIGEDLDGDGRESSFFLVDSGCYGVTDWANVANTHPFCAPIRAARQADVDLEVGFELGELYLTSGFDDNSLRQPARRAQPFWSASDLLQSRNPNTRRIYTAIDTNGDGRITGADGVIEFHEDNAEVLLPYLGLTESRFCMSLLDLFGLDLLQATYEDCGRQLIRYIRGCEITNPTLNEPCVQREGILADIFHSTPVVIEAPTRFEYLHTPLRSPQSLPTLALPADHEPFDVPLVDDPEHGDDLHPYQLFALRQADRDRVALVGSNGGMLHAFDAGTGPDAGRELWAFIPPDVLPKLKLLAARVRHHYTVDGTPWIRHMWIDGFDPSQYWMPGLRNHRRQAHEYRTVAVVGLRRGGNHFFALDVTEADDPNYTPRFLWMFPELGTTQAMLAGQSWNDVTPLPPPIGPIRYLDSTSPAEFNGILGEDPVRFRERWIAALPGGYDPMNIRGRGFHLVDAYYGEPVWSAQYDPGHAIRQHMTHSFAAVPALSAWQQEQTYNSPYFDTLVAGDTGGQLWVGRFFHPDPARWATARAFVERGRLRTDTALTETDQVRYRRPFFQTALLTKPDHAQTLRAYVGTGHREQLRQGGDGTCGLLDPAACSRAGCRTRVENYSLQIGTSTLTGTRRLVNGALNETSTDPTAPTAACTGISGSYDFIVDNCPHGVGTAFDGTLSFDCDMSDGSCDGGRTVSTDALESIRCPDEGQMPSNRFYSIKIFDQGNRAAFDSPAQALTYDAGRFVDGDRENVDVLPAGSPYISPESPGFYFDYPVLPERSATPAVVAGRCAIWSTLEARVEPSCRTQGGGGHQNIEPCEGGGEQAGYMYFRHLVHGGPGCLSTPPCEAGDDDCPWDPAQSRLMLGGAAEPPPPPQIISQVGSGGRTSTAVTTTQGHSVETSRGDELFHQYGTVFVPSDVHDCRHEGADCE